MQVRLLFILTILSLGAVHVSAQFPFKLEPSVDVWVSHAPTAVIAEGKVLIVYELQLVSGEWQPLEIRKLKVSSESGEALATFEGASLEAITTRPGFPLKEDVGYYKGIQEKYPHRTFPPFPPPVDHLLSIGPGEQAVFFVWIERDARLPIPVTLRHEWTFANFHAQVPGPSILESDPVNLDRKPVVELAPPVKPGRWFVSAGPADLSHHRRAQIEARGHMRNAQRFAIDLVKVDEGNRMTRTTTALQASDYFGFGEDVLAVAEGTVVEVLDGRPARENLPDQMAEHSVLTREEVAGNQVSLRLGDGHYALYGHLQPGTIQVKVGERVHVGQVLARIGNSGTAIGPHLHFQLSTEPGLRGEGLPFTFGIFESAPLGKPVVRREHEIPRSRRVVVFPPSESDGKRSHEGDATPSRN
jgi:hypothetical protein